MRPTTTLSQVLCAFQISLPRTAISRSASRPFSQLSQLPYRTTRPSPTPFLRSQRVTASYFALRNNSSSSSSGSSLTDRTSDPATDAAHAEQNRLRREQEPAYQITFTCKPCGNRSSHRMSKHGYHKGTVLIRCPSCENRHVISDHLNIFFDKKSTLEDILEKEGQKLTRGYMDGDMEFWDDGTVTQSETAGQETKSGDGQAQLS